MSRDTLVLLSAAFLALGCARSTVRSGLPPGTPSSVDEHWHGGFLLGSVESGGPYDLAALCPAGWAQIEIETDPLQGLVSLVSIGIYTPQTVTVVCAAPGSPPSPPNQGMAPARPAVGESFPPKGRSFPPSPPPPRSLNPKQAPE